MMSATVNSVMEGPEGGPARAPAPKGPGEPSPAETSFELVRRACAGDSEAENKMSGAIPLACTSGRGAGSRPVRARRWTPAMSSRTC